MDIRYGRESRKSPTKIHHAFNNLYNQAAPARTTNFILIAGGHHWEQHDKSNPRALTEQNPAARKRRKANFAHRETRSNMG
jgi:NAD-dependent oxidoreductase involved in siderophore biosynthesis